ncbi:septum formation initiator family protein [Nocardioides pocheonensis]|uniref:Septum formation initiator family protein n=1 Tax=Nocardioides pocheonensis TaxID=661485 RepID=A0A3N0GZ60_9ACTN|nr:septum formation initiator family protein [Nocardioides pocheonensis]
MPPSRRPSPRAGRPRNTRPGARGAAARTRPTVAPAPRARFTNRAAVLVVVFAVLVVSYASSMRAYLQQREQINGLRERIAASKVDIAQAERERRRWQDPAYVEAQARARFGWVLPGETSYQVLDSNGQPLTGDDALTDPRTVAPAKPKAWWTKEYSSLEAADHPEKKVAPTPATRITPNQQ